MSILSLGAVVHLQLNYMRLYGFVSFVLLISAIIVGTVLYGFINWQAGSDFFGFSPYKKVGLDDLLSYGNLYDGKKVCSVGYYVKAPDLEILKVSMEEDRFTKSVWIDNLSGKDIIFTTPAASAKYVWAKLCGSFQSHRGGEFGSPSVWNHQLTVEKFETFGEEIRLDKNL